MKLIHLSDLHLGKRVNGFSMLEDQKHILAQIADIIRREQPDAVLIAGDVYDKSVPGTEAVTLLDDFLVQLAGQGTQIFVISGNHDSPERMAFGSRLMAQSGVHLAPVYDGRVQPHTLTDAYGAVDLYLLPFVKPVHVRPYAPEREIVTYTDALAAAIAAMPIDPGRRNVLVTHQFVTGAARCDSEELSVGGADNVDVSVFAPFDYVALGHLHSPQQVGRATVRYCGTPLAYSFSEAGHSKSVTVVELAAPGQTDVRTVPLTPLHPMVRLRGRYDALTRRDVCAGLDDPQAYIHITLTDEDDIPDAAGKLRLFYPNLMQLEYDNARTRAGLLPEQEADDAPRRDPLALLEAFYAAQNGAPMQDAQRVFVRELIASIWEDTP